MNIRYENISYPEACHLLKEDPEREDLFFEKGKEINFNLVNFQKMFLHINDGAEMVWFKRVIEL